MRGQCEHDTSFISQNESVFADGFSSDLGTLDVPIAKRDCAIMSAGLRSGEEFAYLDAGYWANCVRASTLTIGSWKNQSDIALWRRIVSALILFSFFWISYVSQTHIHGQSVTAAAASAIVKAIHLDGSEAVPAPTKHSPDSPDDCPLCQAVSLGGVAIVPILIALLILQTAVTQSVLPRQSGTGWVSHSGYAHQTRGPPTL
jgi:hypothetical protein